MLYVNADVYNFRNLPGNGESPAHLNPDHNNTNIIRETSLMRQVIQNDHMSC